MQKALQFYSVFFGYAFILLYIFIMIIFIQVGKYISQITQKRNWVERVTGTLTETKPILQ